MPSLSIYILIQTVQLYNKRYVECIYSCLHLQQTKADTPLQCHNINILTSLRPVRSSRFTKPFSFCSFLFLMKRKTAQGGLIFISSYHVSPNHLSHLHLSIMPVGEISHKHFLIFGSSSLHKSGSSKYQNAQAFPVRKINQLHFQSYALQRNGVGYGA